MFVEIMTLLAKIGHGNIIFLMAIFIVFVYLATKTFKYLIKAGFVVIASLAFPFVMNFLGWNIPLTLDTLVSFVIIGLSGFFVFMLVKGVYHILSIGEKIFRPSFRSLKKKEKKMEKILREHKKEKEAETKKKKGD